MNIFMNEAKIFDFNSHSMHSFLFECVDDGQTCMHVYVYLQFSHEYVCVRESERERVNVPLCTQCFISKVKMTYTKKWVNVNNENFQWGAHVPFGWHP